MYNESGATVSFSTESPWAVMVVTSVMKRAQKLDISKEIIFVDSTSSCESSGSQLTILLSATKVGAVPIAALIHESLTTESYVKAFQLLIQNFPLCFGDTQCPDIFMTDDAAAEKAALSSVWPSAKQLLCHFYVAQAEWRYLWSSSISKERRPELMKLFQKQCLVAIGRWSGGLSKRV